VVGVGVPLYVALGWVAAVVLPELVAHGGPTLVALLLAGGLLYTSGAVCYATRWPNPWPQAFGYHEVFHTAVTVAALSHYAAVWLALAG
jgi:hemolysin III